MDNLTHTLFGAALAKTPLGRRSPLSSAALVVGANFPDIDIVSALWEKPAYLVYHRGFSHSLLGCLAQIVLLGLLFDFLEKRFFRERAIASKGPWLAVAAGLLSHPLLDSLNTYGIRPWLPFSETWIYGDLVFIVDPWLWLFFGGVAFLAGPRSKWGDIAFLLFGLGSSLLVGLHPRAPDFAIWVWIPAMLSMAAARWRGIGKESPHRTALGFGAACLIYLACLWGFREKARSEAWETLSMQGPASQEVLSPRPMKPWQWSYVAGTDSTILVVPGPGSIGPERHFIPRMLDEPRVQSVLQTPEARAWLGFARIPWAWVAESEGQSWIYLHDARYQLEPGRGWSGLDLKLPQ